MSIRWYSPNAFVAFFFFTAFKPTHCAGWVCFLHLHHSKTKDPWSAVHGLFNTSFHFITSPTNRKQLSPPTALGETALPCYLFFWIHRFRRE
jgi:hypothetical protein